MAGYLQLPEEQPSPFSALAPLLDDPDPRPEHARSAPVVVTAPDRQRVLL